MNNFSKIWELQQKLNEIKFENFFLENSNINDQWYKEKFYAHIKLDSKRYFSIYANYLDFIYKKIKKQND